MAPQKVFIGGKGRVTLTCHQCGNSKELDATGVKDFGKAIRAKCKSCGGNFEVLFERRSHYRKPVFLTGSYSRKDSMSDPLEMTVTDLSRRGLALELRFPDEVRAGDILWIQFRLDTGKGSLIKASIVTRRVKANYVGAEFASMDEHNRKELGFYLMP